MNVDESWHASQEQSTVVDDAIEERKRSQRPRRRRWLRRTVIGVGVLVVLLVVATGGVGWFISSQQLVPNHTKKGPSDQVLGFGGAPNAETVVLSSSEGTNKPGVHSLTWNGGSTMVGDIVSRPQGRVERELLGARPPTDVQVMVKTKVYPSDPRAQLGAPATQINVPTELGPAPAWFVPAGDQNSPGGGDPSTWVITVHGQHGDPSTGMTGVPTMHRLGLPVLSISYRNDVGAPSSPDGLLHLGQTEWRDVDAAITKAREMGARRVVLDGSSMGGAAVLETLKHSAQAKAVASVVLDAPALNYEDSADLLAQRMGIPAPGIWAAREAMEWRAGIDFDELNMLKNPPTVRPPTLLIHGTDDDQHPIRDSRRLAASGPERNWPIQFEAFPGATHTQSWNVAPQRYDAVLADFLSRTARG